MKKLSFVLLLLAATLSLSAQDVIYKLSGDSILAKVEAVTDEASHITVLTILRDPSILSQCRMWRLSAMPMVW